MEAELRRALYQCKRQQMKALGVPIHDKPGRPSKYASKEESLEAIRASRRLSQQRQREAYKAMLVATADPP
jgi:hypothetical protein